MIKFMVMLRFLMFVMLICGNFIIAQNDSLSKPFKMIWHSQVGFKLYQAPFDTTRTVDIKHSSYIHQSSVNSGLQFLISKNSLKRNQYYFGTDLILNQNELIYHLNNYTEGSSGHFNPYHSFSQNEFKIRYYAFGLSTSLVQYTNLKNVFVFQKIGITINKTLNNHMIGYSEKVSESYPDRDSSYISPSNPQGWYIVNKSDVTEYREVVPNYISVNPYYQLGVAYKIYEFAVSANVQLNTISKASFIPVLSGQLGIIYGFN